MHDLLRLPTATDKLPLAVDAGLLGALARASAAIARLDQALHGHPLLPAFLYRTRLEAVRLQAGVDGRIIDPWHLAAVLEGLRLRLPDGLRIIERGAILDAARAALGLHQWITAPDFDQEGEVHVALATLSAAPLPEAPLLAAALGCWDWLEAGGTRPPVRAALIRFWGKSGLLRAPVPLTGPRSLSSDAPTEKAAWVRAFLEALAGEALDDHQMLMDLEREWVAARACLGDRRRNSRAALAIDVLAAAPLLSATTLAGAIGMSIRRAIDLLDGFVRDELVVEVTHRAKRRLFALRDLTPLRDETVPPRRPQPGRRPGRPSNELAEAEGPTPAPTRPALSPMERAAFDYSVLDESMAQLEKVIRRTRQSLGTITLSGDGTSEADT